MFKPLDTVIHSPLRLAIISLLAGTDKADFNTILEITGATRGNVSVQLKNLKKAGYIRIRKSFRNNYPHTSCTITDRGRTAFTDYVKSIRTYIEHDAPDKNS